MKTTLLFLTHMPKLVLAALLLMTVNLLPAHAQTKFKSVPTQYIATLEKKDAKSGNGAEAWSIWTVDPGPRGVRLSSYQTLVSNGSTAPTGWQFNATDWWLEEHGLIMEAPKVGIAAGKYLVTGNREVQATLTVFPKDANGSQKWELSDNATIYDVTHLRCRAARYQPKAGSGSCNPSNVDESYFPMTLGISMPDVKNCSKEDYAVLFIIGVEE